jgi:hypothetical protein
MRSWHKGIWGGEQRAREGGVAGRGETSTRNREVIATAPASEAARTDTDRGPKGRLDGR